MNILNQNVIVRSNLSGVIVGKLIWVSDDTFSAVQLENAMRLWSWKTIKGVSLQGVATSGIIPNESVVEPMVSWMLVRDVVDITPMSEHAMSTIPII